MSSQRRRIERMRVQKMRKKVVEKERDEHFNNIRPVIPTKQEWRGHALMTKFDNSGKTGLSVLLF
jgi:hypothetical protein